MSGDGEWHTVRLEVVGRYTQTRHRWLRTKIIKSSHDRHYKKKPLLYTVTIMTIRKRIELKT